MPPLPKRVIGAYKWNPPIKAAPLATQQAHAAAARAAGYVNPVANVMPTLTGDPKAVPYYGRRVVDASGGGGGGGGGGGQPPIVTSPYAGVVKAIGKILTPAQQLAQARALVSPSITQELAAYNKSAGLESSQVSAQALRAQEYAKALGQLTAPSADAIKNQYMSAAAFEQGLGQGLTGDVAQGWQEATDRANAQAQQMTGGIGGTVGQYDPAAARSVALLTGSSLPAATLAEQGSNAYAMAQFARQANVAQVGDIAQQYLQKLTDLRTTQDAERAKILAQRPDLVMKELGNLQTQHQNQITSLYNLANAQQKAKSDAATLAINWAKQQTNQQSADAYNAYLNQKGTLSAADLAWKKKYQGAKITSDKVKNMLAAAGLEVKKGQLVVAQQKAATAETTAEAKLYKNPYTGKMEQIPSGTAIGKNGLPYDPTPPAGSTAKGKVPTLAAIQGTRKKMVDAANKRLHPTSPIKSVRTVWPKKRIVEFLMNQYGNDFLAAYPSQKKYLKQMIDSVANGIVASYPKGP